MSSKRAKKSVSFNVKNEKVEKQNKDAKVDLKIQSKEDIKISSKISSIIAAMALLFYWFTTIMVIQLIIMAITLVFYLLITGTSILAFFIAFFICD